MAMGGANAPAYDTSSFSPAAAYVYGLPSADTLRMDDLLDLSNNDLFKADVHHLPAQPDNVSTPVGCQLSGCFSECYPHVSTSFADDIYVPSEEAAELEWLSKFVEDSFSDAPYPPASIPNSIYSSDTQIRTDDHATSNHRGVRSKRSRAPTAAAMLTAAAANWPLQQQASSSSTSSSSSSDFGSGGRRRNAGGAENGIGVDEGGVRRCTHCASEKTPQWRAGPLGPKTLCNACGVRYKSGRLVPEYRPAASPSFVLTQHSNSHRKVVELRRQKEVQQQQQQRHQSNSSSRLDLMYS